MTGKARLYLHYLNNLFRAYRPNTSVFIDTNKTIMYSLPLPSSLG